jgi:hypothetical protein
MIHLLWCTIRPEVFKQMHPYWTGRSNNPSNIKTHVAVNTTEHQNLIKEYFSDKNYDYRIIEVNTDRIGVCYPSYALSSTTEGNIGDIVVFASDDFLPPMNWDTYLLSKLKEREGGLIVRDGYQLPDSSNMQYPAITIPIMTWGCFEKLNKTIYNPVYTHMYSDCELFLNLKEMNLLIDDRMIDSTTFEHLHHAAGKRRADQLDVQYHNRWKEDEVTWNKRKNMTVLERL